jgi:predicted glycogen debranching enzyme
MIRLPEHLLAPEIARRLEWVEPDGLGGFAMGTANLWPTRRYHSLLTVARRPPVDRRVLLAALEEQLESSSSLYHLDALERLGAPPPEGPKHLIEMALDPFPRFRYRLGSHLVERVILVPHGQPAVLIGYRHLEGPESLDLLVSPLLAGRSFHDLSLANGLAQPTPTRQGNDLVFQPYPEEPALYLRDTGWTFHSDCDWVEGLLYRREQARGYQYREDLLRPGHLEFSLAPGEQHFLLFSATAMEATPTKLMQDETRRRHNLRRGGETQGNYAGPLTLAADRYLVQRSPGHPSILAGYPWFEDWGRDTFLSLPGLILEKDSLQAKNILETFAAHESRGLIPNRFGDRPGETTYNAADASLWFVVEYERLRRGQSELGSETLWNAVRSIFQNYLEGTRFGIRVDPKDGLLSASSRGVQLTWMDAKVDDLVVTPRAGKPVELQGLWYFCCKTVFEQATLRGEEKLAAQAQAAAAKLETSFHRTFWIRSQGHYGDCLTPEGSLDRSLRPNQLLLMSLRYRLVPPEEGKQVLEVVEKKLLTPYGLRTLDPTHSDYRGRYEGSILERDQAYHQGTVWPWLLGPYGQACLTYRGASERTRLLDALEPLLTYLTQEGLGNLPEVFDGDPPHNPGGCPAQAWSVAQIRHLYLRLHEQDPYNPVEI